VISADANEIILQQSNEALLADQRLVGNVAAQAKREGVVVKPPQLYVYYRDFSPAYHLAGYRATLARELDLTVGARRMERSMVRLDRLLERAQRPDGSAITPQELPASDLFVVLYQRADCPVCDQVQQTVETWLADRSETVTFVFVGLN